MWSRAGREGEMKIKPEHHAIVQTLCTVVQTVAVVGGIVFGVLQVWQWTTEQDHQRRQAALEKLSQLDDEPLRAIVQSLPGTRIGGRESMSEFIERTAPLVSFMTNIRRCVRARICDEDVVLAEVCPIVESFSKAVQTTNTGILWVGPDSPERLITAFYAISFGGSCQADFDFIHWVSKTLHDQVQRAIDERSTPQ